MEPEIITVSVDRTLPGFARKPGCDDEGFSIGSAESGTMLTVDTDHSRYRLLVVDGGRHLVMVQGGSMFPEPVPAVVQGASGGGSFVKTGWIGVDLRMELFVDHRWVRTSPVRTIAIDRRSRAQG
jgi:hypothetical protein